ncbi:hypothetical protein OAJ52_08350 [Bacteroidia bacterium]|jgi:hypothetical protein|nr:hypothetical protein [Bacteroidia bacterium]|tara:strand:+ start:1035 stop:1181 length:147 start_codon:yes stop_codon:yes gene_type:complete
MKEESLAITMYMKNLEYNLMDLNVVRHFTNFTMESFDGFLYLGGDQGG